MKKKLISNVGFDHTDDMFVKLGLFTQNSNCSRALIHKIVAYMSTMVWMDINGCPTENKSFSTFEGYPSMTFCIPPSVLKTSNKNLRDSQLSTTPKPIQQPSLFVGLEVSKIGPHMFKFLLIASGFGHSHCPRAHNATWIAHRTSWAP